MCATHQRPRRQDLDRERKKKTARSRSIRGGRCIANLNFGSTTSVAGERRRLVPEFRYQPKQRCWSGTAGPNADVVPVDLRVGAIAVKNQT